MSLKIEASSEMFFRNLSLFFHGDKERLRNAGKLFISRFHTYSERCSNRYSNRPSFRVTQRSIAPANSILWVTMTTDMERV